MNLHLMDSPTRLFAADYLRLFPRRGKAFALRHLGLKFYTLRDCVCAGAPWQAIAPVHGETLPYIFLESCPYSANEGNLPEHLRQGLALPLVDLDEAAPLFSPGSGNLWHWTCESLPKLLALEEYGYTGPYIVPHGNSMVEQSLAMHGIASERILYGNAAYRIKCLVLGPRLSGFWLAENMTLVDFLRNGILAAAGRLDGSKRCYVRRIGSRRILNEDELIAVLHDFEFEHMTPENLTLAEQYRCMTNVDCSIMAHGANSTLTLAQKASSVSIELFGNRYVSYNNLHAVRLLNLRYHSLVQDLDPSCGPVPPVSTAEYLAAGTKADLIVDPLHVRVLLENALR